MNSRPDYYAVIGVSPDADREQIRAEYVARARAIHPDTIGIAGSSSSSPEALKIATVEMALLNEAWEVLSDQERRREFDRSRAQQPAGIAGAARTLGRLVGSRRTGSTSLARRAGGFLGKLYDEFEKGRHGTS